LLLPVNTRFLTPADYAVLELLEQIVAILSILLGSNLSTSLGYFFFEKESPEERSMVASTTIIGATVLGILVAFVGALFARSIGVLVFGQATYTLYLTMLFISLPVFFGMEAEHSWLRVTDKPAVFALTSIFRVTITIMSTVTLVAWLQLGVLGVISSSLISATIPALLMTIYCFRKIPLAVDFTLLARMFRFSIPISLSSIAMFIIHFGDRFILPHYRPLSDLGIYGIAYKIGMLISLLSGSFNSYWTAQIFQLARRDDANEVIARVFTYLLLVLSACSLGLIVFSRPVIHILTTAQFEYAAVIAPLIIIAYYFRSLAEFFRCFFIVHGRPEYESFCNWTGAVVCLAGYFILIPRFGILGAGYATAITFLVIGVMSVIWTYRLKPYRLEIGRILKITGTFAVLLAMYSLIPVSGLIAEITWGVMLMALFAGSLWVLRFASAGELIRVQEIVRQARSRIRGFAGL
jgi:O-antigen/teichoic acid export membrane protein